MLLTARTRPLAAVTARTALAALVLAALSGCVRVDESAGRPAGRLAAAQALAREGDDLNPDRAIRARRMASRGDPRLVPSPRDQRQARAMVQAQADMFAGGEGYYSYGFDGSASQPDKVTYPAQPGALRIDYEASPDLNTVDGDAHAIALVIYHLSDTAAFDGLAGTAPGLRKLLEGERFDSSVKGVDRQWIQPGTANQLLVNRYEDGRHVALVAGYALPSAGVAVFTTEYGLGQWKKAGKSVWDRREVMFRPLPLHLSVCLGPDAMAVRNTGLIHDGLKEVHQLMAEHVRYLTYEDTFVPVLWNPQGLYRNR
ncbi:MAG: type VI secretion lipoprotein TssJ [Planctomycetaceae bacterium]|nr:type VI secretion lipoprotein TssJ [Planctomycetaceae bacterium]